MLFVFIILLPFYSFSSISMPRLSNKKRSEQLANARKMRGKKKMAEFEVAKCESTSTQSASRRKLELMERREENATAPENEEQSWILAHVFLLSRLMGDLL